MNRIGVDLGGTKIEAVALTPEGTELGRHRLPTPSGDYRATLEAIRDLVAEVEGRVGPTHPTVGVGTPGALSPRTGLLKNSNSTALNGRPLDVDLAEILARPVILRNDADCFALSEARDGSGVGVRTVFGAILGTGVGGGVIVDGKGLRGPNAISGEWGHNPLPWLRADELPGDTCYCGKNGCIETFLSGPGFAAQDQGNRERRSAPEIVEAARAGEPTARESLARYVDRLARSLATIINILDPDVIVLGGGMSNVDELYEQVPKRWADYVFGNTVDTPLVQNRWGDSSGVRGAAWLVEE
ncbi:MAG: ROK family protein [Acidimicrobiia bacterium]